MALITKSSLNVPWDIVIIFAKLGASSKECLMALDGLAKYAKDSSMPKETFFPVVEANGANLDSVTVVVLSTLIR